MLWPAARTVERGVGPGRREATALVLAMVVVVVMNDRLLAAGERGGVGKERLGLTRAPKMTAKK